MGAVLGGIAIRTGLCTITMRRLAPTFALLDWLSSLADFGCGQALFPLAEILFMFGQFSVSTC